MTRKLLVGDIGSTKSTWWYGGEAPVAISLSGYNPLAHEEGAGHRLVADLAAALEGGAVDQLWYYGAGVVGATQERTIGRLFGPQFPQASIHVRSDVLGAAHAACGFRPGNVIILGTGSHAATFDGASITRQAQSLGYILGDEGGGCDLGKDLLRAYFYGRMPDHLAGAMAHLLPAGRTGLLAELARAAAPNQYLAAFVKVAVPHAGDPWVMDLVGRRFRVFIDTHLVPLQPEGPIHVVGAIGCIFGALCTAELVAAGFTPGTFIRDPSRQLFELHRQDGRSQN